MAGSRKSAPFRLALYHTLPGSGERQYRPMANLVMLWWQVLARAHRFLSASLNIDLSRMRAYAGAPTLVFATRSASEVKPITIL